MCPYCGAMMKGTNLGWECPFCNTLVDGSGRVYRRKQLTYAERIRAMTDDELSQLICSIYDEDRGAKVINGIVIRDYDEDKIRDWLQMSMGEYPI